MAWCKICIITSLYFNFDCKMLEYTVQECNSLDTKHHWLLGVETRNWKNCHKLQDQAESGSLKSIQFRHDHLNETRSSAKRHQVFWGRSLNRIWKGWINHFNILFFTRTSFFLLHLACHNEVPFVDEFDWNSPVIVSGDCYSSLLLFQDRLEL